MDLQKINQGLTRVKLRVKGDRVYLRGQFPAKPGDSGDFKRYELSTGFPNTTEGLKLARAKALEIESDLYLQRFDWGNYLGRAASPQLLGDWIDRFEVAHWERVTRGINSEYIYNQDYRRPFGFLPIDGQLSEEIFRRILLGFAPDSRDRERFYIAYSALARFTGLELSQEFKRLKGHYSPKERFIPTDEQIIEVWSNWRGRSPWWKWAYGVMVAYGVRPHELFFLDVSGLNRSPYVLKVIKGKTGPRSVYPVLGEWVGLFGLGEVPKVDLKIEGRSHYQLGRRVSVRFKAINIGFVPYALRDAYAVRCAVCGIDSSIAARWMGHSLAIHANYYQRYIDEVAMERIWLGKFGGIF